MRRVGHIFDQVLEMENLKLAFWKASRAKRARADQRAYADDLDGNLSRLRDGLRNGTYPVGNYRRFAIFDPKEREICAAAFGERVLHHALMNICEPHFERGLVDKTFACRKGYGQLKAVACAHGQARRFGWYLKCDVRKYFDSIPHDGLRLMLSRKFKDPMILGWFDRLIGTYETSPRCGLPIGNLTSQHLANLYLDRLDRFVLERHCGVAGAELGYVRYMDDFIIWSSDKDVLVVAREAINVLLRDELGLGFKQTPVIQRTARGMNFLGLRVFPQGVRAARASLRRFSRKRRFYERLHADGVWNEEELQRRVDALTAFLRQADTLSWRRRNNDLDHRRKTSGNNRDLRGGNWNNNANNCRSANRNNNNPSNENNNNGFRLACSAASSPRRMIPAEIQSPHLWGENEGLFPASSVRERRGRTIADIEFDAMRSPSGEATSSSLLMRREIPSINPSI